MEKEPDSLKTSDAALSTIKPEEEPFLIFDVNSKLSFEDQSTIYDSLVALAKAGYPFDTALQDKAVRFLKSLSPEWDEPDYAAKLVSDLVSSSAGSHTGFVESIVILLSSPHSTIVGAAISFLRQTFEYSSPVIRCPLVESDLVTTVLTTVQPHTLSISGNEEIFGELLGIIDRFVDLATPLSLEQLGKITTVDQYNHREMIFQNVVLPSSHFMTFLISNRYILAEDLFRSFMSLLSILIRICPYHHPTLEFVLASPIVMAFSRCLSFIEDDHRLWVFLGDLNFSLNDLKKQRTN
ncbi:hypothetical protein BLNAU_5315 [Blattamonas nauphoetae]|uniref:Uncharacterized protein n=1 Tax=Blattamonas nauphoetae TaxID=2049346 RepID=A0ABQ9Y7X1_9EUKA|nr:hypothetical protein BLNAU_5315 [Blattamonas nauphoetae]